MSSKATPVMVVCAALVSLSSGNCSAKSSKSELCAVIPKAWRKVDELKPGSSRRVVEQSFALDDGMQFPPTSRYTFKECRFIKVDVEFSSEKGERALDSSPTDKVLKASRLISRVPVI